MSERVNNPGTPIGLADVILSLGQLAPDASTARDIVRLLGLASGSDLGERERTQSLPPLPEATAALPETVVSPIKTEPATHGEGEGEEMVVEIEVVERIPAAMRPAWLNRRLLPPENGPRAELELEPLLRPHVTRNILGAAIRTWHAEGKVDTRALVERIARLMPIRVLPRRVRPTLREGAQVIIDVGQGMTPFMRDTSQLVDSLQRVAGDRIRIHWFDTDPLLGGEGPRRTWKHWEVLHGSPLVAISDLGISPTEPPVCSSEKWLELSARCRRAGAPLIAFVPWSADRWPVALARTMRLVTLDRGTNVASVRRQDRRER